MRGGYWTDDRAYGAGTVIKTVPVKCEYLNRFDLAVIDPASVEDFTSRVEWETRGFKNDKFWSQSICAAVELKYCQLGEKESLWCKKVEYDVEKLRLYLEERRPRPFLGIALVFLQSGMHDIAPFCTGIETSSDKREGIAKYVVSSHGACRRFDCS
jgi:hypothetical protein